MPQFYADESAIGRSVVNLALIAAISLATSEMALAADHRISAQTTNFICSSVKPGDTVTLPSGTRGPLKISNCNGTPTNPIIIRNDPDGNEPAVIRRSTGSAGGFVFSCTSCIGVEIDGSYKWEGAPSGKTYGIKVTMTGGAGPTAFFRLAGFSRFVTIRNVEIDGAWPKLASGGIGMRVNDNAINRSKYPQLWREGILIEDNYVHDIKYEGIYIGPNHYQDDLPLRNIEIRFNRVEDTGWEAINTKSMWTGNNSIHHNEVRRAGKNGAGSNESSQFSGIKGNSSTVKIYNNWIETTGQHGISAWTQEGPKESEGLGPFNVQIWNNVIVDAGALWRSNMSKSVGINIGAQSGMEKPIPTIYNNTIVNPRGTAIGVTNNTGAGFVRDNIVAGSGSNPIISAPSFVKLINNRVGTVSQIGFVNAGSRNFRLGLTSPARNGGGSIYPPTDHDDVTRPKEGASDQGAFEGP